MDERLKNLLDISTDEDLVEAQNYIKALIESRNAEGLRTLDEVMAEMFEKYPGTKYFDFGMYGKGDYECAGECYTNEGIYDFDEQFLSDVDHDEDEEYAEEIPGYSYPENWLNTFLFGEDGEDYDRYHKEEEPIMKAKGYPIINEERAKDLPNGTCVHLVYVKGIGIKEIEEYW